MLDVSVRAGILALLDELRRSGLGILMITHDLSTAAHYADRIAVMYLGRIVEEGPAREVVSNPKHPYTKALISVVPQRDPRASTAPQILVGETPNPINIPPAAASTRAARSRFPTAGPPTQSCAFPPGREPGTSQPASGPSRAWISFSREAGSSRPTPGSPSPRRSPCGTGRIAWVGPASEAAQHIDRDTRVIDLVGHTVVPGFQDAHCHPAESGVELARCVAERRTLTRSLPGDDRRLRVRASGARLDRGLGLVDRLLRARDAEPSRSRRDPARPARLLRKPRRARRLGEQPISGARQDHARDAGPLRRAHRARRGG